MDSLETGGAGGGAGGQVFGAWAGGQAGLESYSGFLPNCHPGCTLPIKPFRQESQGRMKCMF